MAKVAGNPNWVKGQSGNPGGRPKDTAHIRDLALARCPEAIERLEFWMKSKNPKASVAACIALLDRGLGKPTQPLAGENGKPLNITLMNYAEGKK